MVERPKETKNKVAGRVENLLFILSIPGFVAGCIGIMIAGITASDGPIAPISEGLIVLSAAANVVTSRRRFANNS